MIYLIIIIIIVVVFIPVYFYHKNLRSQIQEGIGERLSNLEGFKVTKTIDGYGRRYLFLLDDDSKQIAYITDKKTKIVKFKDIIAVEMIEDGTTTYSKSMSRTIGGALVGGALAGGAGSIVGGLSASSKQKKKISSLDLRILVRDINKPSIIVNCFDSHSMTGSTKTKSTSLAFIGAKVIAGQIKDIISVIIDQNDTKLKAEALKSAKRKSQADELIKLNELKEKGIITAGEFELMKKRLIES